MQSELFRPPALRSTRSICEQFNFPQSTWFLSPHQLWLRRAPSAWALHSPSFRRFSESFRQCSTVRTWFETLRIKKNISCLSPSLHLSPIFANYKRFADLCRFERFPAAVSSFASWRWSSCGQHRDVGSILNLIFRPRSRNLAAYKHLHSVFQTTFFGRELRTWHDLTHFQVPTSIFQCQFTPWVKRLSGTAAPDRRGMGMSFEWVQRRPQEFVDQKQDWDDSYRNDILVSC